MTAVVPEPDRIAGMTMHVDQPSLRAAQVLRRVAATADLAYSQGDADGNPVVVWVAPEVSRDDVMELVEHRVAFVGRDA